MVVQPQKRVTLLRIFGKTKFLCHEDPSKISSTPWWQWLNSSGDAVRTKGSLEGVCGRLHWFLPSLPFSHCLPNADSDTWLNNLIFPFFHFPFFHDGRWKWSRTDIWILRQCDCGEDGYIAATEWTHDFHMRGLHPSSTHRKHKDDREEKDKCAKYKDVYPDAHVNATDYRKEL